MIDIPVLTEKRDTIRELSRKAAMVVYYALFAVCLMFPSGNVLFINLKYVFIIALMVLIVMLSLTGMRPAVSRNFFSLSILFLMAVMVWFVVGYAGPARPYAAAEAGNFLSTFVILFVTTVLLEMNIVNGKSLIFYAVFFILFFNLIKTLLILTVASGTVDIFELKAWYVRVFRYSPMVLDIRTFGLQRFSTINDALNVFSIPFLYIAAKQTGTRYSKPFQAVYILLAVFALFTSYSRFLWFAAVLFGGIYYLFLLKLKYKWHLLIGGLAIVGGLLVVPNPVGKAVTARFSDQVSGYSDQFRDMQKEYLIEEVRAYFWTGNGLGGYSEPFFNRTGYTYSYENQWLSFVMKFGAFGMALLIFVGLSVVPQILFPVGAKRLVLFAWLVLWLSFGVFNPYLVSSFSGAMLSLIYVLERTVRAEEGRL